VINLPIHSISLEDLLKEIGVQKIKYSGYNIMGSCPFHKDNHPSFGIHQYSMIYNCYSCKRRGPLAKLLMEVTGKSIGWCLKYVLNYVRNGLSLDDLTNRLVLKEEKWEDIIKDVDIEHRKFCPQLLEKGFFEESLKVWSIGYDKEKRAAVIYWKNKFGKVVGRQHKFFNTENRFYKEADTGNFLFGEDKVIGDSVIVVESELDCVWAWQHNLFNVVAIGGTPSKEQIKKLRNYREIILWLDNDNPGIWSSRMINYSLKKTNQIYTVNYLSDKKDLGEMDMEEIWNTWRTRHLVLVTEIGEL